MGQAEATSEQSLTEVAASEADVRRLRLFPGSRRR
jgi:hypothetical protein